MKLIKQTFQKSLALLVASILSLHAAQSSSAAISPDVSADQAWQNLQNNMASLSAISAPEDVIGAESSIVAYQSALSVLLQSSVALNPFAPEMACAAGIELLNVDSSNPLSLLSSSVIFGDFENTLLNARAGSADPEAFSETNNFYKDNESLIQNIASDFMALQCELLNVDASNPNAMGLVKSEMRDYCQTVEKLQKKAHDYKKSELQDSVNAAALTSDEQQLWNQFQSTLTEKCKAACSNYKAAPTFARCPWVELDLENLDPTNPAAQLQIQLEKEEAIDANIGAFKLLEQGCLYEFLNVLLSKRYDRDSSLNSFHQLQDKLNQFLNNVDVSNSVAVLEAQVDMLAYEKEVAASYPLTCNTLQISNRGPVAYYNNVFIGLPNKGTINSTVK
ncbi:MAG: hypothetical protein K2W97_00910 [Chthoniobacterales bacterium]|nr:hypothetical protein [Chthoniobacterales bacterium]